MPAKISLERIAKALTEALEARIMSWRAMGRRAHGPSAT